MPRKQSKRPAHIDKAMKELRSYARSEMAKTEVVQFRIDRVDFEQLVEAATTRKMPMGALVRDWVLDHLNNDRTHTPKSAVDPMFVAEHTSTAWTSAQSTKQNRQNNKPGKQSNDLQSLYRNFLKYREQEMTALEGMFKLIFLSDRGKKTT